MGDVIKLESDHHVTVSPWINVSSCNRTEHSENKIIMQSGLSGNEVGSGVLQPSVQQTCLSQNCRKHNGQASD